jgi:hypothetical protein
MVEYFLGEHFEYVEVVFADVHVVEGGLADVLDEGAPSSVPLVLHDLDEDRVALRQDRLQRAGQVVDCRVLQDQVHDVVLQELALLGRQGHPLLLGRADSTLMASSSRMSM